MRTLFFLPVSRMEKVFLIKFFLMRLILLILLFPCFLVCSSQKLTTGGKLKPEQAIMDVRHYNIVLNVDTAKKSINGYTTIDVILSQAAPVLLFDLMDDLKVQAVSINGKSIPFTHRNSMITINPVAPIPAGKASVKISYGGSPHIAIRPPWDDGFTWTSDSTGNMWLAITAEGTGGKIYFPCKDHPSDEPNEGMDMVITVPKNLVVAGPGLLQKVNKKKNTATYFWKTNYSINNYSIVFNAGVYDVVSKTYTTVSGNKVPMQFYVLKYHAAAAAHHLDVLESMVKVKEKYFGEYPWVKEKIGIVETPHLGMEHQSMNAYGNKFRYTKVGGQDFDWLMNHEFGHEWWGNKVTAKDWADFWIHEGIASFGDQLYVRDTEGEEAYIKFFKNMGMQNKTPVVQGKDIDGETAYIGDIYSKGAFFMHTLRYIIGDTIFFPALKKLATDTRYTYDSLVNTDDVEQLFSQASGIDLKPLFDFYLRTIQKLGIQVTAQAGKPDQYKIQITNFDMPLPVEILTDKGKQKFTLDRKGIIITSTVLPQIDPDRYYLKHVVIE
ncbi:MAG: M1 family metallopeptidase [Ferruginibacter sp.]